MSARVSWLQPGHLYASRHRIDGIASAQFLYTLAIGNRARPPYLPFVLYEPHRRRQHFGEYALRAGWIEQDGSARLNDGGFKIDVSERALADTGAIAPCAHCGAIACPFCSVAHDRGCTRPKLKRPEVTVDEKALVRALAKDAEQHPEKLGDVGDLITGDDDSPPGVMVDEDEK